jgi:acyl-CoA synthetase (AMP-forming)/AMP-acid ligase II/acyl carrier protein
MSVLQTIGDVIEQHAVQRPEQPAIVGRDFAPLSFQKLNLHIRTIGELLQSAGIGPSARVGIVLPQGPEAALFGISIAACAISVPLNPTLNPTEFDDDFRRLDLDAVVLPAWQQSTAWEVAQRIGFAIFEASKVESDLSSIALRVVRTDRRLISSDTTRFRNTALILKTSGTTGNAKLVRVTHRNLLAMASKMRQWFNLSAEDRCACFLPTYYAQGCKSALLVPLLLGGSVALPGTQSPDDITDWVKQVRATWFSAGPTYLQAVLDRLQSKELPVEHSLRFILSSSSYLPEPVRTELENILGIPILEFYGLSEAGVMAANPAPPLVRKPGTAGLVANDELAVRNEDGHLLDTGEVGEIVVRGPSVSPGYDEGLTNPALSFRREWLATGDLGLIDSDGYLSLVGRKKEIINRGGEKISPYEIEKALLAHPAVREAAAFSVPHPRLGENPAAAVVLAPGSPLTPSDLREFLSGKLAWFKIPRRIAVLDGLPKSRSGKVQRSRLTENSLGKSDLGAVPVTKLHAQLLKLWCTFLKTTELSIDDDFFDKGGDSLLAIRLLLEIERLTGRTLPESILFEAPTVRQLADRLAPAISSHPSTVIKITPGEKRSPILFFHGDFNFGGYFLKNLSRKFERELPVIAIAPHGLGTEPIPRSIEDMASDRLPAIFNVQPQGPYRLVGHCNGGLVAFETARLLMAAGHKVEFVAMIDAPSVTLRRPAQFLLAILNGTLRSDLGDAVLAWTWRMLVMCQRLSPLSWAQRWALIRGAIRGIAFDRPGDRAAVLLGGGGRSPIEAPETEKFAARERKYASAMARYFPAPLAVPIVYFSSEHDGRLWERISPDVEVIEEPGGHYEWLTIRARHLTRHLRSRLIRGVAAEPQVTDIHELPPFPQEPSESCQWDMVEGLDAEVIQEAPIIPGFHIMRLAAAGPDGRHALGARFDGLSPGGIFRAITWVKTEGNVWVMIEARDSVDPHTGRPLNYGVARLDLGGPSIVNVGGAILKSGIEAAEDGWQKIWVELRSGNGRLVISIGLLEGSNGNHVFKEWGQEVTFGGFEIYESSEGASMKTSEKRHPSARVAA